MSSKFDRFDLMRRVFLMAVALLITKQPDTHSINGTVYCTTLYIELRLPSSLERS